MSNEVGVVFDLDGTLIDSVELHALSFKKACETLGMPETEKLYREFKEQIGKPLKEIINILLPDAPEEIKEKLSRLKWQYTLEGLKKIKPVESAVTAVKLLKSYPLAIFTSSTKEFAINVLKKLGLLPYFKAIVAAEDAEAKPSPDGLIKACKALHCEVCVYIGDRPIDEETAKNAGFPFVYVQSKPLIKQIGKALLLAKIGLLKKDPKVKAEVEKRIEEFKRKRRSSELFLELAFCLLTANYNAERAIKIHETIGRGFLTLSKKQLERKLIELGYRYPSKRSEYIVEARKIIPRLKSIAERADEEAREILVKSVKGLGYKEASHFLRNVGKTGLAIVDFHIVDLLSRHWLIKKPKSLTRKSYLEIEKILKGIAKEAKINMAELDLYLWYTETGKVLK